MCGLAGFWTRSGESERTLSGRVRAMAKTIAYRGPDDAGTWAEPQSGIALGHRRLSIMDLSPAGHQPMLSIDGRFCLVFNGEIYNHREIRQELELCWNIGPWRGHSDTETLLEAFSCWGVETTIRNCIGMFAFAVWDSFKKELTLARDRFGEKPLYYGWMANGEQRSLVFGSELKALEAYTNVSPIVCREALSQYMRFGYVPAPRSIYRDVFKLEPGCMVIVQGYPPPNPPPGPLNAGEEWNSLRVQRWWSLAATVDSGKDIRLNDGSIASLEYRLNEAVRAQLLADVPVGAFLSGGVDSSLVAALMQKQSSRRVKTFTIGFDEVGFDEAPHARAVARHLHTEHFEMRVSHQMAQDIIPSLPCIYDEPFADSSQIPMHLVCKVAREQVTVALSGDGGDELFGGYNRYFWGPRIWYRLSWLPQHVRTVLGGVLQSVPIRFWNLILAPIFHGKFDVQHLGYKVHKLARRLENVTNVDELYLSLVSIWDEPCSLVSNIDEAPSSSLLQAFREKLPHRGVNEEQLRMMYFDTNTYLPGDILCKVDRAAMSVGLETRAPFLDHRVAELAWQLPLDMKVRGKSGKWALREILYQYVPRALIERPKAGFAVPVGEWLRGPLRSWAENLLDPQRLDVQGFFRSELISEVWRAHLSGQDRSDQLWTVLMFQAWLEQKSG